MGQAKARGSFEQRKVEGIARLDAEAREREIAIALRKREDAEREAALPPAERQRNRQARENLNAMLAVTFGLTAASRLR